MSEIAQHRRSGLQTLKRLVKFAKAHRKLWFAGLSLGLVDAAAQISIPLLFRFVLNGLQTDAKGFFEQNLDTALIAAGILVCVFFPAAFFFHTLVTIANARTQRDLRTSLYEHVQRLSADFFSRTRVGEVSARINQDIVTGCQSVMQLSMGLMWHLAIQVLAMTMMLIINPPLFLMFVVFALVVWAFSIYFLPRLRKKSREVRDAEGIISATITEYLSAMELIRAFSRENATDARVANECSLATEKMEKLAWFQYKYLDILQVISRFVAPLTLLFVGGWMVMQNIILIGDLAAFWGYWRLVGQGIQALCNQTMQLFVGLASLDRVFDFFEQTPMVEDSPSAEELTEVEGKISFENVWFNYPVDTETTVLAGVSFAVEAGETLAIVGPSGAGKSTILQLLLRFYDPLEGAIRIDGRDIREFKQRSVRDKIGVVMQENVFFSGTIADNLLFAKPDATREQMRKALSDANALQFIEQFPHKLDTLLGERGVRLSGGEKQRLACARAFLKNPPILVFDEATSALDSVSEMQVQAAMEKLLLGRTAIIIAHRIATVRKANKILVLNNGKILDIGTHSELISRCELYATLCKHQSLEPS